MSEQPTVAEQLWSQIVTNPPPLDRDGEGDLTDEGYHQLHERARWASGLLVDLICGKDCDAAATFAVMSGFAWTAAPCVPLLNSQRKTERQAQMVQRVVDAITAGETSRHSPDPIETRRFQADEVHEHFGVPPPVL